MNLNFDISNLPSFSIYTGLLLIVLVIDHWVAIPQKYHPIYFFRILLTRLSDKVHPSNSRSKKQQYISGSLAILAAVLPWVLLCYLFIPFTEYPLFFEAVILWLSLNLRSHKTAINNVEKALHSGQKALAKDRLSDWCLRKTDNLSSVGLIKASCESLVLRNCYYNQAIALFFLLLGPFAALALRLTLEANQVWSAKKPRFIHFGQPIRWLTHFLLLPVTWITTCINCLLVNPVKLFAIIRQARPSWQYALSLKLLAAASLASRCQLGGPVIYDEDKIRRAKLSQHPLPDISRIKATTHFCVNQNLLLLLMVLIANCAIIYF
ncbi:cobalamin biosynthesis protein [Catenovulum sp. SM1970]|uniref:cobalamin biosynthesis protein CobD/CbiB n=1 Tax=Marinifaba aquimaris TaxID=2741323 RepID=UPI0015723D0E|nr:cobalamin biosynthesis protein [Marinifaba aquimaris]NTS75614.1 cobalamin biosynthesis protein [Marinifaba aquimaris]